MAEASAALVYDGLIRQYLHMEPPDHLDDFAELAGQALAMEDRMLKGPAAAIGKAMGGK